MSTGYVSWHYSSGRRKFMEVWGTLVGFLWRYFSVAFLLKTLFSPWRRDVESVQARGFHPILLLQSLAMNVMTRIIGAVVRTGVILAALAIELAAVVFGTILLAIYLALPAVALIGLVGLAVFVVRLIGGVFDPISLIGAALLAVSAWLASVSFGAFRIDGRDYYAMTLPELARLEWFSRIWNRLGIMANESDPGVFESKEALEGFLNGLDMSIEEFDAVVSWEIRRQVKRETKDKFWLRENLAVIRPIGTKWIFAYTVKLDRYVLDLSEYDATQYRDAKLIGMERDLEELKTVLLRPSQNNAILVGETGVGKDTIVHTLARQIREMRAGEAFNDKRILSLDIREVVSSLPDKSQTDGMLNLLFREAAEAGNVILFIGNIHQYLKSDPINMEDDISSILSAYLAYPDFQIIATTTPAEFHSIVEKKSGVMKYFDKIQIEEMGPEETTRVLLYKLKELEAKHVVFSYQSLREIVRLSDRYVSDSPFPEKALDMMEEVLIHWNNSGQATLVTPQVVDEAVSAKIKVPLGEVGADESERLMHLEDILHQRVVGQEFAIKEIAETMRRARIGMASGNKPLGSFLFLGPTGVGKTESTKALAEAYFGDENRMIRLDMSEYQTQESIDRLLGSAATNHEGYLISQVKDMPHGILLLDEIEKAYPDILNLFLQILDEGHLTDAFGKKLSFKNLIIIATSNAGSDVIRQSIQSGMDPKDIQATVTDHVIKQGIFRPEFLNRFEGVIFFHPLEPDDVLKITGLMLEKYAARFKERENIVVRFDPGLVGMVAKEAYDPVFGARAIDRFVQDRIEDKIVKKIIAGSVKKGGTLEFTEADMAEE